MGSNSWTEIVNGNQAQLTGKPGASGAKAAGSPALPVPPFPPGPDKAPVLFPGLSCSRVGVLLLKRRSTDSKTEIRFIFRVLTPFVL